MASATEQIFLGFDLSTQQLKAVAVSNDLEIICEEKVSFDSEMPEFRTQLGVNMRDDGATVTCPTMMWVKALDLILEKLKIKGLDFFNIVSLSGSAQQHGSVFWKKGARNVLKNLHSDKFLHEELQSCFAIRDSPCWMDSSTVEYCRKIETVIGGAQTMANVTGSKCYERFTASQINKIYQTRKEQYSNCERISLVSSFLASLFLGDYAEIDYSDGSGMNLLNINTKTWSEECLKATAPDLAEKLGTPVPSYQKQGNISNYFVDRYGFSHDCQIITFTGDNPASLIGMQLNNNDLVVSLGTSDTLFFSLENPKPTVEGHILCHPMEPSHYIVMLCFKNGSTSRERIKHECAEDSWELFNELLESTPRGNFGNMGYFYDIQEIVPFAVGDYRFNKEDQRVSRFSKEVEVRAAIEGQFINRKYHLKKLGFNTDGNFRILATGGASSNKSILQVLSDVFNAPVYIQEIVNSANLGAAYLAKFGFLGGFEKSDFWTQLQRDTNYTLVAEPSPKCNEVYGPMLERTEKHESTILQLQRKL